MEKVTIGLDPSETLVLELATGTSPSANLTISNPSDSTDVTFKVKTTRPLRYLVRPNQGIIGPKGTATVSVILQTKDCDELLELSEEERQKVNDKFLVQTASVEESFCNSLVDLPSVQVTEQLTQKWASVQKKDINNRKLRCSFSTPQVEKTSLSDTLLSSAESPPAQRSVTFEKQSEVTSTSANSTTDRSKQELFGEIARVRKKYDELVAFTVQLTSQRDGLIDDLDKVRQQLKQAKADAELVKSQPDLGLRQRKPTNDSNLSSSPAPTMVNDKSITFVHVLLAAVVCFLLGRFYG